MIEVFLELYINNRSKNNKHFTYITWTRLFSTFLLQNALKNDYFHALSFSQADNFRQAPWSAALAKV